MVVPKTDNGMSDKLLSLRFLMSSKWQEEVNNGSSYCFIIALE